MTLTNPISKLHLNSLLVNEFYLSPCMIETLEKHYLLHWDAVFYRSQLSLYKTIKHQDVEYIAVQASSFCKGSYVGQLKLSFRKPFPGTGISPHVLVRIL